MNIRPLEASPKAAKRVSSDGGGDGQRWVGGWVWIDGRSRPSKVYSELVRVRDGGGWPDVPLSDDADTTLVLEKVISRAITLILVRKKGLYILVD